MPSMPIARSTIKLKRRIRLQCFGRLRHALAMKVAFVANPESPNGWYRGIGPMVALKARGHDVRQVWRPGDIFRPEVVDGCDVLHIHRASDRRAMDLARRAKAAGALLVWDNDDDLASVPRNNAGYRTHGGARGARSIVETRKMIRLADLVTAPSRKLVEIYREYGAMHVDLIENYVRDESALVPPSTRDGARIVVGWLGGKEHHVDAERLPIRAALQSVLDANDEVEIVTIGVGLGLRSPRYRHLRAVSFHELDAVLAQLHLGLAPIADLPFNRARSSVKLKEYAVVGVPWLASAIGPYAELGEKQGGVLVPDDQWHDQIERVVTDERRRRKLAKRALKWGRGQTVSANVLEWERRFGAAMARAA